MSYIFKVFEHLKQLWMVIWQHTHTVKQLWMVIWQHTHTVKQLWMVIWQHTHTVNQLWMVIWQNTHTVTTTEVSPDLGEFTEMLAEIKDDVSVEMIPIRYC